MQSLSIIPDSPLATRRAAWRMRFSDKLAGDLRCRVVQYRELVAGAALTTIGFLLLAGLGGTSAIATRYVAEVPYCEAARGTFFAQPVNTVSNIAYCLAGLAVLHGVGRDRRQGPAAGTRAVLSQLFGWIAILQGFTSAAFHGTLTRWGGVSDNVAMNLLVSLVLLYNVVRLFGGTTRTMGLLYAALNTMTTAYLVLDDSGSLRLFAVLVVAAVLSECAVLAPHWVPGVRYRIRRSRPRYLGCALASFAVGWGIWRLSDTGGPLCEPTTLLQGHAAWHFFTALTVLFLSLYFRSEHAPIDAVARSAHLGVGNATLA